MSTAGVNTGLHQPVQSIIDALAYRRYGRSVLRYDITYIIKS